MDVLAAFDLNAVKYVFALRDPHVVTAALWISQLGEWYVVIGLALILMLFLALKEKFALAQGLALSVATSGIATFILKSIVARPRPPEIFWAYPETWYSFPSAHAAMSVAFYGFLIYLVWQSGASHSARGAALLGVGALILVIGFLRVYLGVHYPTDVLGGWILGGACLWLGIWSVRTLRGL